MSLSSFFRNRHPVGDEVTSLKFFPPIGANPRAHLNLPASQSPSPLASRGIKPKKNRPPWMAVENLLAHYF
jgi:hypothetical protein